MKISKRAAVIKPSLTLALTAKAKAMQAQGIDVVSFGAGEPDFDTPDFIKNVAIEDLQKGVTKYTAERGGPDLLKAVCETLQRDYGLKYETNQVMVSVGGKHSLYNAIFCMVDEGDEVIIPAPYWVTYPEQVRASGGV
ncbi:MAG TPA: aminotransferase class I/II-fold pyridoxal phosphate-dependent enzyme, partial [Candidatus Sumerlaeota bacterium]|nr:aminotransferase class I/II-fold pyridoxal phosphate-dependent enzyme [Candidatus Sumerlaeota bacterium]